MSRLDSFIRRMCAQRDCLNMAASMIEAVSGPVLELGLGNGRTFDHLRSILPNREIFVFDRQVAAHPDCVPDDKHLILGDIFETLPAALTSIGAPVALAHTDIGTGDAESNAKIASFLAQTLPGLMAADGIILSDQDLAPPGWTLQPLPDGVQPGRYYIYRR
ncbi:MAG: class I SAM-dependent methyltransferase [Rhodospirillales bacterium]|nr:class I SAM-dependent methyltransferase [Rhodospirillales bacterium]